MNISTETTGVFRLTETQKYILENLRETLKEEGETVDDLIDAAAFALLRYNNVAVINAEVAGMCAQSIIEQACNNFVYCMAQRVVERLDDLPQWETDLKAILVSQRMQPLIIAQPNN